MATLQLFLSFKPYYNWNTFNTDAQVVDKTIAGEVLNLIITGIPSILPGKVFGLTAIMVLNLIITGIPSILQ